VLTLLPQKQFIELNGPAITSKAMKVSKAYSGIPAASQSNAVSPFFFADGPLPQRVDKNSIGK
jgi:hypothetical protein